MNRKRILVVTIFLIVLAAAIFIFSQIRWSALKPLVIENTVNKNSEWHRDCFQKKLFSLKKDADAAIVIYEYDKRSERWTKGFVINHPDDHGFASYVVENIDETGVTLSYKTTFNHRSFGKNLISNDQGTFKIPWSSIAKIKTVIEKT